MQKIWQNFTRNSFKLLSNDSLNQNIALIWGLLSFTYLFAHRQQEFMNWNHWRGGKVHLWWSWKKNLINKTKLIVTFKLFYLILYNCFEANFESEWLYCFYDDYPSMNWPLSDTDLDVISSLVIDFLSFVLQVKILWNGKIWPEHKSFLF